MDAALLEDIAHLPAAKGKQRALAFARVLADDLRRLEAQLEKVRKENSRFHEAKQLLDRQAALMKEHDELEDRVVALMGIKPYRKDLD